MVPPIVMNTFRLDFYSASLKEWHGKGLLLLGEQDLALLLWM